MELSNKLPGKYTINYKETNGFERVPLFKTQHNMDPDV